MDTHPKYLKYGIIAGLAGLIGHFVLPILATMALNAITVVLTAVFLYALWTFLPAISEALAQLSYRLWEKAIREDPIAKLRRDLAAHKDSILAMEKKAAEAAASVTMVGNLINEQKNDIGEEELATWKDQLANLKLACVELVNLRDQEAAKHVEFTRVVAKAEANLRIGQAFKSALGAFSSANTGGSNSEGSRVALNEIQTQLATSQAQMAMVLSRKTGVSVKPQTLAQLSASSPQLNVFSSKAAVQSQSTFVR